MVGTSGSENQRFSPVTASARRSPDLISGSAAASATEATWSCPASTRLRRRTGAAKRHVHHVDAGAELQLLAGEMRLGAGARAAVAEGVGLRFRPRDQIGDRLDAGIGTHHEHVRRVHQLRDRREVLDRIVGQVVEQRGVHRDRGRGHQQRVAVRLGARGLSHADVAGRAAAIFDDDALPERLRHEGRKDAADDVGRSARRERHDHRDRPVRIFGSGRLRATAPAEPRSAQQEMNAA